MTVIIVGVLAAVAGLAYNAFTDETRSQALLADAAAVDKPWRRTQPNGDLAPTTVVRNANTHPAGLSA